MARIASTTVMQMVGDDGIVFVDDRTGAEVVVPMHAVPAMVEMAIYFASTAAGIAINPVPQPPRLAELILAREATLRTREI